MSIQRYDECNDKRKLPESDMEESVQTRCYQCHPHQWSRETRDDNSLNYYLKVIHDFIILDKFDRHLNFQETYRLAEIQSTIHEVLIGVHP